MNRFKKPAALLLALSLLLTACAGNAPEATEAPTTQATVPPTTLPEYTLTLEQTSLRLGMGDTQTLTFSYDGPETPVWSSSDETVVTVSEGVVTAGQMGNAVITVTAGDKTASAEVEVIKCLACESLDGTTGMTFDLNNQYTQTNKLHGLPLTLEAVLQIDKDDLNLDVMRVVHRDKDTKETVIFSNDDTYEPSVCFSITEDGHPVIALRHKDWFMRSHRYVFDDVNVFSQEKLHLAITFDQDAAKVHCYVNGERKQTIKKVDSDVTDAFNTTFSYAVGGNLIGGNINYFQGKLYSLAVWADTRSADEIAADVTAIETYSDVNLMAAYDLTQCEKCRLTDLSAAENDLKAEKLWQSPEEVEPVGDYAYSFAVIGDTQELSEDDPSKLDALYDWIIANKESQKIQYVIGLGDITQKSYDHEWEYVKPQIYKMNGVVPYMLARGNHDVLKDFNKTFNDDVYSQQLTGVMKEGDMTTAYRTINIGGTDYMFLALDFGPSQKQLDWASKVISEHPDHKVIIFTHAYMYRDGTTLDGDDAYPASRYPRDREAKLSHDGDDMWNDLICKHENILMVLSGHDPWQHIAYRQDKGEGGNTVTQMLVDAQHIDGFYKPFGMVAMFYFSEDGQTLTVRYYSTAYGMYGSERSQFTIDLS